MHNNNESIIVCIMGPTACGKSDLAIQLAQQYPFEIISVDSALVYQGMDVGTAKPSQTILEKLPHHLVNICDPSEKYSAAEFRSDVLTAIQEIIAKKKVPLLVGGTMLYFKALLKGLSELPSADPVIRKSIEDEANKIGWQEMHEKLKKIDPVAAKRIHPNDPQRIQRALEIYELTGQSMSQLFQDRDRPIFPYRAISIGIMPSDRSVLHEKIKQRFMLMLDEGFLQEVKALFKREDLSRDLPSIRSVGYRQAWDYLSGNITYDEMVEKAIVATRQLAKRQMTWLRHWDGLKLFESAELDLIVDYLCSRGLGFCCK